MAYHVGDRRLAEATFLNGRGHAIKQPPPELTRLLRLRWGHGPLPGSGLGAHLSLPHRGLAPHGTLAYRQYGTPAYQRPRGTA